MELIARRGHVSVVSSTTLLIVSAVSLLMGFAPSSLPRHSVVVGSVAARNAEPAKPRRGLLFALGFVLGFASLLAPGSAAARVDAAWEPAVIDIPAGPFIAGSSVAEREYAYRIDESAYGHDATRRQGWYDAEAPRATHRTAAFAITRTPITNRQYAAFVAATGHRAPDVDRATWRAYGLIHPYERTRAFAWRDGRPPAGREEHPVVLVSQADAIAYAAWLSQRTGRTWRLPTEAEWEKAARGTDGRYFPWGDEFDPARLNSHDAGPFDTVPAGSFPAGASPFGMLDAAGQVYEWTLTAAGQGRAIVKGGSWDDRGCGVCRPAARHARPAAMRHILIGMRLVRENFGVRMRSDLRSLHLREHRKIRKVHWNGGIDMASKLTVPKLALIAASTAMAGGIYSGAQAAQQVDCDAGLTRIAIASEEGGEGGVSQRYAHCVPSVLAVTPAFTPQGTTERGVAGRPAMEEQKRENAWPDPNYISD